MKNLIIILIATALLLAPAYALNEMTEVGVYTGEWYDNYFGYRTDMGDFDGDLMDEFVISAYGWNEQHGKIYWYEYDGDWPTDPFMTVQGDTTLTEYGHWFSNLGDVNNDGLPDLGVSELYDETYHNQRFDVYFGSNPMDTIPDWDMYAVESMMFYGTYLDSCGDVNGDGWADFMMKNTYWTDIDDQIEIYYGGEIMDTLPDWTRGGYDDRLYPLGDINNDGFDDILTIFNYNYARFYLGGSPMDTIPDFEIDNSVAFMGGGGRRH